MLTKLFYWLPQFTHVFIKQWIVFHSSYRKINKQTGVLHSWKTYCCQMAAAAAGTPQAPGVEQSRLDSDKNTGSLPNFGVSTQLFLSIPGIFNLSRYRWISHETISKTGMREKWVSATPSLINCPFTESVLFWPDKIMLTVKNNSTEQSSHVFIIYETLLLKIRYM